MTFDEKTKERFWKVWRTGQTEPVYQMMLVRIRELEKQYEEVLETLPQEQDAVIRDYVSQCEEMSTRMLEIACTLMHFSETEEK